MTSGEEQLIQPSPDTRIFVIENSCQRTCPHCFLDPGEGSMRQAEEIALRAHELGYGVYFYATEASPRSHTMYQRVDQDTDAASICMRGETAYRNLDWLMNKRGRIGFSLHGATAETHRLIAGEDTFDMTVEAIRNVAQMNTTAKINIWCTLHRKNIAEIRMICELARDVGASYLTFIKLSYLGRAQKMGAEWFLTPADIAYAVREVEAIYESGAFPNPHIMLAPNWGMTYKQAQKFNAGKKSLYSPTERYCPAGTQRFAVDSKTLKVYPCHLFAGDEAYAIGRWSERGVVIEDDTFIKSLEQLAEPCGSCAILDACGGGCRAEAIAEHRRLHGEYEFKAGFTTCRGVMVSDIELHMS